MTDILPLFGGGAFHPAQSTAVRERHNPSRPEELVVRAPIGNAADVAAAVAAASDAWPAWRNTSGPVRADALYCWGEAIAARSDELARAIVREVGKPIGEARGEVGRAVVILRYYAGEAVRDIGEVIPAQAADALQFTLRDPLGPVALVTPWNFPLAIPLWKAAPALAFGNTVVLKPSELSSGVAHLLAETALTAALPAGIFNVVHGEGGKNVVIVTPDGDLDRAAALTAAGAMRYAGQKCTATSRVIVDRRVEADFLARLEQAVAALPLGPVDEPAGAVGPLITAEARSRIEGTLREAPAEVLFGGRLPTDGAFAQGHWFAPRAVRLTGADHPLALRELFGPVLGVLTADDTDHAITLANDTPFGLSASIFTRDLRSALDYVSRIEVGLVRVNGDTTGVDPHAPFGGTKSSSSGSREQGRAAREFYTETRTVQIHP